MTMARGAEVAAASEMREMAGTRNTAMSSYAEDLVDRLFDKSAHHAAEIVRGVISLLTNGGGIRGEYSNEAFKIYRDIPCQSDAERRLLAQELSNCIREL